ncbi:GNAT family N-acetyltransferase [Thalassolituus sp. LLYu03]|uniref:GNAT family N-acetyltransferase n=1 Tax=Thalassolituus sp. LLYu03 TaxID=3421656 RepID=UPI003D29F385
MKYQIVKLKGMNDPLFGEVANVRMKVFVEEDQYPSGTIVSNLDRDATHFVALDDGRVIGSVSANIKTSEQGRLPIESYMGPLQTGGKVGEICKLAVLNDWRSKPVALYLMVAAYDHLIESGVDGVVLWSMSKKAKNIRLYSKFGFKRYGDDFICCNSEPAIPFFLDVAQDSVYDGEKSANHRRFTDSYKKYLTPELHQQSQADSGQGAQRERSRDVLSQTQDNAEVQNS